VGCAHRQFWTVCFSIVISLRFIADKPAGSLHANRIPRAINGGPHGVAARAAARWSCSSHREKVPATGGNSPLNPPEMPERFADSAANCRPNGMIFEVRGLLPQRGQLRGWRKRWPPSPCQRQVLGNDFADLKHAIEA
jgi:hypothetical protein